MQEYKTDTTNAIAGKINVPKIVTASLAGLAGGAAIASAIGTLVALIVLGSLLGGSITGLAEYQREKKLQSSHDDLENL